MRRVGAALVVVILPVIVAVALAAGTAHRAHPGSAAKTTLFGNPRVASRIAHQRAASAEVFPFTAKTSGTAAAIRVYVDWRNRSTKLIAGIYLYRNGRPGLRLASATLSQPRAGRWNSLQISRTPIRTGRRYGISILGRGGSLYFRDRAGRSCRGSQSDQESVTALPAQWGAGHRLSECGISAYVAGVAGRTRAGANQTTTKGTSPHAGSTPRAAAIVGTAGAPAVRCTTTLYPGADVQSALATASAGDAVCLNGGNWPHQTLTGLSPASPGVTLAPAPGAIGQVNMAGITATGTVNNLTVEGIHFSSSFSLHAGASNVSVKSNTFQNFRGYAIELCSGCVNSGPSIDNISVTYNQIDHTFYCLRVASAGGHYTFSHNVCGPGIGEGGGEDAHYIQAEDNDHVLIDNNAFEGPFNATAIANGAHVNVAHLCGNDLQFNNNLLWHTQAVGQSFLAGDDCPLNAVTASNNLIVEDPTRCASNGIRCSTYSIWADVNGSATNVTASNNTIVDSTEYGGLYVRRGVANFSAHNDLAANDANKAYSFSGCNTCSNNASDDSTGDVRWTPRWQNTNWTPNDGSPWTPPPADYYKPSGVPHSFGYQGTIGP